MDPRIRYIERNKRCGGRREQNDWGDAAVRWSVHAERENLNLFVVFSDAGPATARSLTLTLEAAPKPLQRWRL